MSVLWKTTSFGYDGDFVHGHIKVNYWQEAAHLADEMDRQYAEIREAAFREHAYLIGADKTDSGGYE